MQKTLKYNSYIKWRINILVNHVFIFKYFNLNRKRNIFDSIRNLYLVQIVWHWVVHFYTKLPESNSNSMHMLLNFYTSFQVPTLSTCKTFLISWTLNLLFKSSSLLILFITDVLCTFLFLFLQPISKWFYFLHTIFTISRKTLWLMILFTLFTYITIKGFRFFFSNVPIITGFITINILWPI